MASVERRSVGPIAWLTINRPQKRNAIDPETSRLLNEGMVEIESDTSIRVTILTGAGDVFCSGADLGSVAEGHLSEIVDLEPGGFGGLVRLQRRKPVIAAVNGHALAGGFELVLACDLVVALDTAEFGLPEVARGLIAGAGGLVRLPRQIPAKRAMEMILLGTRISAREALNYGLVNRLASGREEVLREAEVLAETICENAPLAVSESRRVAELSISDPSDAVWEAASDAWRRILDSDDSREGPAAFIANREPRWTGR